MNPYGYTALALTAGVAVPIMAAMNAGLGTRFGSAAAAAAVLCAVALLACVMVLWVSGGFHAGLKWPAPHIGYAAGLLFSVYILLITFLAPRMGVGNAIFFVLLGQLVTAAIIDHFALFGAPHIPLTAKRVLGLVVMTIGILLARRPI